jgi:hypothetical protein
MTLSDIYDKRLKVFHDEINHRCAVTNGIGEFMKLMRDMRGYEEEFKTLCSLYCKSRVKMFEQTLVGVDKLRIDFPELHNHNDFIIQIATWEAELVEAENELANLP